MYKGFKVELSPASHSPFDPLQMERGAIMHKGFCESVSRQLRDHIKSPNYLDGTGVQKAWFPQVKADIFISHAHQDRELAFMLAGWLHEHFNLKTFIDSAVWGYGEDLQKELDELYCRKPDGIHYHYQDRNLSTSHVHIMLASAISTMMDRCECLFFLNTPSSIKFASDKYITQSPWIYYEIGQSRTIRIKKPLRFKQQIRGTLSEGGEVINKAFSEIAYEMDLSHLARIGKAELLQWLQLADTSSLIHPLDLLYQLQKRDSVLEGS